MINNFFARNRDFCRSCPKCVPLLTNIAATTPPHRIASAFGDPGKDSINSTTSTWQLCKHVVNNWCFMFSIQCTCSIVSKCHCVLVTFVFPVLRSDTEPLVLQYIYVFHDRDMRYLYCGVDIVLYITFMFYNC